MERLSCHVHQIIIFGNSLIYCPYSLPFMRYKRLTVQNILMRGRETHCIAESFQSKPPLVVFKPPIHFECCCTYYRRRPAACKYQVLLTLRCPCPSLVHHWVTNSSSAPTLLRQRLQKRSTKVSWNHIKLSIPRFINKKRFYIMKWKLSDDFIYEQHHIQSQ